MNGASHTEKPCFHCELNKYKAERAATELSVVTADRDREHRAVVAERTAREAAESMAKSLQAQIDRAASEPPPLPGVREFIAHCESGTCEHAHEWQAVKQDMAAQFLANLTPEMVQAKAQEMDLIPRKITIKGVEEMLERKW
ncbi:MAG: hypothetical protein HY673_16700 [Chloroflexi bacterium]|nr:hypothetical protein [Chloroflexota bacterium]